jgi:hypothetical protein
MELQNDMKILDLCDQVAVYEMSMLKLYGAVIYGHDLWKVLGYPTGMAFRQSVRRKTVPVPTFKRSGYRMRFARTHDIAKWLVALSSEVDNKQIEGEEK